MPCHELVKGYKSDPRMDHRQRSKLSLVTSGLRNFLDYGGGKRVRHKGLCRCKLDTYPDSSKSQSGYILKVGAIS